MNKKRSACRQAGFAHIILLLLLLIGLAVTVYLVSQKTNFFSHASNPPIVFKSLDGKALPLNSSGIPLSTSPSVLVELTSTLGAPVKISGPISGSNQTGTVSYRTGFDPSSLASGYFSTYLTEPTVFSVGFPNTLGTKFFWVEFKDSSGKTAVRSAQLEIVGSLNGFGKAAKFNNETSNNAYAVITPGYQPTWAPSEWTLEGWIKTPKAVSDPGGINSVRAYGLVTYTKTQTINDLGFLFSMMLTQYEGSGDSQPVFQALTAKSTIKNDYMTVGSQSSTRLKADTWNHIAVTGISASNTCTLKLYINGTLADSSQKTSPQCKFSLDQAQSIWIAKPPAYMEGGIGGHYFPGAIDEVRFSAKLQYTGNFTPPTTPFLPVGNDSSIIAQYHFDGNVDDSGWYHHKTQVFGNVSYIDSTIGKVALTPSPTPTSQASKRVFVTSTVYNGNLGGLTGADSKCQTAANNGKLGGTWKAWLSDKSTSAGSRLAHSTLPYKLLNGTTVANNWADLTDGSIATKILVNELGKYVSASVVMTNTFTNGTVSQFNNSCNNWSLAQSSVNGTVGYDAYTNSNWTYNKVMRCSDTARLYCFEQ